MLTNYIKIALRNIFRNKLHSFINVIGLSIGMACALLLILYVMDELSWDKHNSKYNRIYIPQTFVTYEGQEGFSMPSTSFLLGGALKNEYSDVEETARTYTPNKMFFIDENGETINENYISLADPEIFKIFDFKFIYGSPEGALDSPHTIVLNETLPRKYFGDQNPVGKILSSHKGTDYFVKGVFEDLPGNTSMPHKGLISMKVLPEIMDAGFYGYASSAFTIDSVDTFILLRENGEIKNITEDSQRFKKKYMAELDSWDNMNKDLEYQSLADYHLRNKIMASYLKIDILKIIYILSSLALLILLIASINYMNLATAKSMGRAKEVGVRKVLGADRASLMRQFLSESMIITIIAMLLTLVLVELTLPAFNNLMSRELDLGVTGGWQLLVIIIIVTLVVGIISGSYPAIFLSSFLPAAILGKGHQSNNNRGLLRKTLVIIQYTISIVMIITMMLSIKQMQFFKNMDLGFNENNIYYTAPNNEEHRKSVQVLKKILSKYSGITSVAESSFHPTLLGYHASSSCKVEDTTGRMIEEMVDIEKIDNNYINLMGMKVVEGRSFDPDIGSDRSTAVLISETFARSMGWKNTSIDRRIEIYGKSYQAIGVFKDCVASLYKDTGPALLLLGDENNFRDMGHLAFKINPGNSVGTIKFVKEKLLELYPLDPPEIRFLEDYINSMFSTEKMLIKFLGFSAFLCVMISCLGLFGLSSFIAESKTKEIGIRKVNGAAVWVIVFNLTINFLKLVLISSIVACPIAYYLMSRWIEKYAYRIDIGPWTFIIGVAFAMIIACLTVSYHSIKAAMDDPVKALRYE